MNKYLTINGDPFLMDEFKRLQEKHGTNKRDTFLLMINTTKKLAKPEFYKEFKHEHQVKTANFFKTKLMNL
jgi:hypothetical protein